MSDETFLRYGIAITLVIISLIFLYGLYRFGTTLFWVLSSNHFSELRSFFTHGGADPRRHQRLHESVSNWYQNHLKKRNDFWEHYGQVALAGFAIAKASSSGSNLPRPDPPPW